MEAALEGVEVVEYGDGIGSAFCANLLSGFGANVRSFRWREPPHSSRAGDIRSQARALYLDSGKTVTPDWPRDELPPAAKRADVVIYGNSAGHADPERPLADYESCRSVNSSLIYVALTTYGVRGPLADWAGVDLNAQALSGWPSIVGFPDDTPLAMNYDIGPLQHGLAAAGATLAALVERRAHGRGEFADIAESDVIAASIRMYSLVYRFLGIDLKRSGYRAPGSSGRYPHAMFPCKDGFVIMICRSETDWLRFITMMGNPSWADEERYKDFFAMGVEYPEEVDALIKPWLLQHSKEELAEMAATHRVPLAPVRTIPEVLQDEQLAYRHTFERLASVLGDVMVPTRVPDGSG